MVLQGIEHQIWNLKIIVGYYRRLTSHLTVFSKDTRYRRQRPLVSRFWCLASPHGKRARPSWRLLLLPNANKPTLIIVHNKELLSQWIDRITTFLGIPKDEIGIIGNGKHRIEVKVTVGIINSITLSPMTSNSILDILVDECHRTPSRTFTEAVSAFDCKYMFGLSATPYRRDGLTKLIGWYLGRKVDVQQSDLTENDIVLDVEVITKPTDFMPRCDPSQEYHTDAF